MFFDPMVNEGVEEEIAFLFPRLEASEQRRSALLAEPLGDLQRRPAGAVPRGNAGARALQRPKQPERAVPRVGPAGMDRAS